MVAVAVAVLLLFLFLVLVLVLLVLIVLIRSSEKCMNAVIIIMILFNYNTTFSDAFLNTNCHFNLVDGEFYFDVYILRCSESRYLGWIL